mgnify:CR=1 FL=1
MEHEKFFMELHPEDVVGRGCSSQTIFPKLTDVTE